MMIVHRNAMACKTINIKATPTFVPSCALPKARQNASISPPELTGNSVSFPPIMVVAGGAFFFLFMTSRDTAVVDEEVVQRACVIFVLRSCILSSVERVYYIIVLRRCVTRVVGLGGQKVAASVYLRRLLRGHVMLCDINIMLCHVILILCFVLI